VKPLLVFLKMETTRSGFIYGAKNYSPSEATFQK